MLARGVLSLLLHLGVIHRLADNDSRGYAWKYLASLGLAISARLFKVLAVSVSTAWQVTAWTKYKYSINIVRVD